MENYNRDSSHDLEGNLIVELVSNPVWGGGERYALDLSSRLLESGASPLIVTRGSAPVDKQFKKRGLPVVNTRLKGIADFSSPALIARIIKECSVKDFPEPDKIIIHAHNFKDAHTAVRVKRRLGKNIRVVVTRHLVKPGKDSFIERGMYRDLDSLVFVSRTAYDAFFSGFKENSDTRRMLLEKACVIPNAVRVDFSDIKRSEPEKPGVRFAFIGRLNPEKGIELMLDSLAAVKDMEWSLILAGKGVPEYEARLKERAATLGIADRIEWTGHVEDISTVISRTDVGLFPSLAVESFGLTILEFMKGGIPVVSTDTGAQKEIIEDGYNGILTKPDVPAFSHAIKRILKNEKIRKKASAAASATADEYSYDKFFNSMLKAFNIIPL